MNSITTKQFNIDNKKIKVKYTGESGLFKFGEIYEAFKARYAANLEEKYKQQLIAKGEYDLDYYYVYSNRYKTFIFINRALFEIV